jgi:putative sugar O-methyltransferase
VTQPEYQQYLSDEALTQGLSERLDPASDSELAPVIQRLCDFYRTLKTEQLKQGPLFLPGGEWADYLREQERIYAPCRAGNLAGTTALFRNFWRNELGPVVKQYATFEKLRTDAAARAKYVDLMAYDYMVWLNLLHAAPSELAIPPVGNPWGYVLDGVMIAPKALRYHVLAHQIRQITSDRPRPVVAEIGAGYGGTAHFLLRGKEPMVYIDFDLPEVLIIAAYYLMRTLPHRRVLLWQPGMKLTATTIAENDVILLPNWMLPSLPAASVDLFFNTFSLSEMPYEVISEYLTHIERTCRGYFLYNNMDRAGVFNRGHERVPCSKYPVSPAKFKQLYKRYDLFQRLHSGRDGDYREVLLQRIHS